MPDKKLTDSEIVKALECHRHIGKETCDSCPLQGVGMCSFVLINEVYNRFNRLQAENEMLGRDVFTYEIRWAKATANNEKLQNAIDEQDIEIARLYKDIEKLNIRLRKTEHQFADIGKMHSVIKAEAYKEFWKELHKLGRLPEDITDKFAVGHSAIDNLLKELVGDK